MKFNFSYRTQPESAYSFRYGLESRGYPRNFSYLTGTSRRNYDFRYDTRDQIYVEPEEKTYIAQDRKVDKEIFDKAYIAQEGRIDKSPSDTAFINVNRNIFAESDFKRLESNSGHVSNVADERKLQAKKTEMLRNESKVLSTTRREVVKAITHMLEEIAREAHSSPSKQLSSSDQSIEKGYEFGLDTFKREYLLNQELNMHSESVEIEAIPKSFSLNMFDFRTLSKSDEKDLSACDLRPLKKHSQPIGLVNEHKLSKSSLMGLELASISNRSILKDLGHKSLISHHYRENLTLNKRILLEKSSVYKFLDKHIQEHTFEKDCSRELDLCLEDVMLYKELSRKVFKESGAMSLIKDFKGEGILKELKYLDLMRKDTSLVILGEKVMLANTLDILKDNLIRWAEKKIVKKIKRDTDFKGLEKITTKKIFKDTFEMYLEKAITKELNKDDAEVFIEKAITKNVLKDSSIKIADRDHIKHVLKDTLISLLDRVKVLEVMTHNEINQLERIAIKEIAEKIAEKATDRLNNKELLIDIEKPIFCAYRDLIKEDYKKLETEHEIFKEKDKEIRSEFRTIVKNKEIDTELYKRFWFIRATNPTDWKIVPYSDYPYEDEPVVFDETLELTPENWQLDMVDVEDKMYQKIDRHPIPFGTGVSDTEIALAINIMVEMLNILVLLWSRMFYDYSGYTGTQAVTRLTRTLYEWLTLETSVQQMSNKGSTAHYLRCYRWIRWEAEKVAVKARDDMSLAGNYYIDEFVFELIYYMENHHFDTTPFFEAVEKMDEFRALIPEDDPQNDITFILDKVKGIRHRVIECRERKSNE